MPEKIILSDGTEKEVPTDEEINNWRKAEAKNKERKEQLNKLNEKLGVDDGASIVEKVEELSADVNDNNIENIRNMRNTIRGLKKALKEKGVETDDSGKIVGNENQLTAEQIQKIVDENTDKKFAGMKQQEALSKYSEDERKKIEPLLDRAMALGGTMEENLSLLEAKLFPEKRFNPASHAFNSAGGGAPRSSTESGVTDETVKLGKLLGVDTDQLEKGGSLSLDEV